jgi:hypothetical protein
MAILDLEYIDLSTRRVDRLLILAELIQFADIYFLESSSSLTKVMLKIINCIIFSYTQHVL